MTIHERTAAQPPRQPSSSASNTPRPTCHTPSTLNVDVVSVGVGVSVGVVSTDVGIGAAGAGAGLRVPSPIRTGATPAVTTTPGSGNIGANASSATSPSSLQLSAASPSSFSSAAAAAAPSLSASLSSSPSTLSSVPLGLGAAANANVVSPCNQVIAATPLQMPPLTRRRSATPACSFSAHAGQGSNMDSTNQSNSVCQQRQHLLRQQRVQTQLHPQPYVVGGINLGAQLDAECSSNNSRLGFTADTSCTTVQAVNIAPTTNAPAATLTHRTSTSTDTASVHNTATVDFSAGLAQWRPRYAPHPAAAVTFMPGVHAEFSARPNQGVPDSLSVAGRASTPSIHRMNIPMQGPSIGEMFGRPSSSFTLEGALAAAQSLASLPLAALPQFDFGNNRTAGPAPAPAPASVRSTRTSTESTSSVLSLPLAAALNGSSNGGGSLANAVPISPYFDLDLELDTAVQEGGTPPLHHLPRLLEAEPIIALSEESAPPKTPSSIAAEMKSAPAASPKRRKRKLSQKPLGAACDAHHSKPSQVNMPVKKRRKAKKKKSSYKKMLRQMKASHKTDKQRKADALEKIRRSVGGGTFAKLQKL